MNSMTTKRDQALGRVGLRGRIRSNAFDSAQKPRHDWELLRLFGNPCIAGSKELTYPDHCGPNGAAGQA
jgi:hypothetical protein